MTCAAHGAASDPALLAARGGHWASEPSALGIRDFEVILGKVTDSPLCFTGCMSVKRCWSQWSCTAIKPHTMEQVSGSIYLMLIKLILLMSTGSRAAGRTDPWPLWFASVDHTLTLLFSSSFFTM